MEVVVDRLDFLLYHNSQHLFHVHPSIRSVLKSYRTALMYKVLTDGRYLYHGQQRLLSCYGSLLATDRPVGTIAKRASEQSVSE